MFRVEGLCKLVGGKVQIGNVDVSIDPAQGHE